MPLESPANLLETRDGEPSQGNDARDEHRLRWNRQASRTTQAAFASKAVALGVRFITIPIALRMLGAERYGLWLAVTSLVAWIGFAGPAIGSGLVNALSTEQARGDRQAMKRLVSTAVLSVTGIGLLLALLSLMVAVNIPSSAVLGIAPQSELAVEARQLTMLAALLIAGSLSFDYLVPLCSGLQEGYLTGIATIVGNLISLLWVASLALQGGGSVLHFAVAMGTPPLIANMVLSLYIFLVRHPDLRPSWRLWDGTSFRSLVNLGGWMLVGYLGDLVIFQSPNILIANHYGPAEVPRYAVPAAMLVHVASLCNGIVYPYWPAISEASMRCDWAFIRRTIFKTMKITVAIMGSAAICISIVGQQFVRLWAGENAVPSQTLLLAIAAYSVLIAWGGNANVLLMGLGMMRTKALLTTGVAIAQVVGFLLLSGFVGVAALPAVGAVAVFVECLIAFGLGFRYIRNEEQRPPMPPGMSAATYPA